MGGRERGRKKPWCLAKMVGVALLSCIVFFFLYCAAHAKNPPLLPPVRPSLPSPLSPVRVSVYICINGPFLLPFLPPSLVVPRPSLSTKERESRRLSIAHRALTHSLPPSLPPPFLLSLLVCVCVCVGGCVSSHPPPSLPRPYTQQQRRKSSTKNKQINSLINNNHQKIGHNQPIRDTHTPHASPPPLPPSIPPFLPSSLRASEEKEENEGENEGVPRHHITLLPSLLPSLPQLRPSIQADLSCTIFSKSSTRVE